MKRAKTEVRLAGLTQLDMLPNDLNNIETVFHFINNAHASHLILNIQVKKDERRDTGEAMKVGFLRFSTSSKNAETPFGMG
jgi:hypothetical protein